MALDTSLATPKGAGGPHVEPAAAAGGSRFVSGAQRRRAQGPKRVQPARAAKELAAAKGGN